VRILFLDTASAEANLALCDDEQTLTLQPLPKQGESRMLSTMETALKEVRWTFQNLTHLACTLGPGGFTSLRVGVTAMNALAFALKIPSTGIHLSDLWRERVNLIADSCQLSGFLWLHSTRRTQLFVRGFGTSGEPWPEPTLIDLEEATKLQGKYVGELLEEHKQVLTGCMPLKEIQPLETVLPTFLRNLQYEKQQLLPWYGREA
jgi:tRNA threonylcarbamoyl adenosine modification protein YeaZ